MEDELKEEIEVYPRALGYCSPLLHCQHTGGNHHAVDTIPGNAMAATFEPDITTRTAQGFGEHVNVGRQSTAVP